MTFTIPLSARRVVVVSHQTERSRPCFFRDLEIGKDRWATVWGRQRVRHDGETGHSEMPKHRLRRPPATAPDCSRSSTH